MSYRRAMIAFTKAAAADRAARQQRHFRDLVAFDRLRDIRLKLAVPVEYGGLWGAWSSVLRRTVNHLCRLWGNTLRSLPLL